ncbi:MAG: ArgE/DapE family deacylase [Anaerolineae bacterium]|nr:ArgE/DapE family deacylase [Anaerolineae bacterium]
MNKSYPRPTGPLSATEERVLAALDIDGMLEYLCDLVAVPSLSGEETAAQEHVAAQMARCGLELDVWELDFAELSRHPSYSAEVDRRRGLGVVGVMGDDRGGRSLIFNGHSDVVPAGDPANWRYPPWQGTIANGNVYGRGALDMKGGLCCAIFAAKAIHEAGVRLKGKLMIESVIGEEDGGAGTLAAVVRGYQADGAVIMEPTELMVAPAQAGALNFRINVPGLSAHGCFREEGVSAFEKFIPIYQAIMALEQDRNQAITDPLFADYSLPHAICIGTIRAGDWASSVAEWLTCEGRFGIAVNEDIATARRTLEQTVAAAAQADSWLREHPPRLEWWGGQFHPASIPVDHPIVGTVGQAFQSITGRKAHLQGMTYGADMRLLVNDGNTPTVMFGPGDVRKAHQPDEHVPIANLVTVARTLALTAMRFCGVI